MEEYEHGGLSMTDDGMTDEEEKEGNLRSVVLYFGLAWSVWCVYMVSRFWVSGPCCRLQLPDKKERQGQSPD